MHWLTGVFQFLLHLWNLCLPRAHLGLGGGGSRGGYSGGDWGDSDGGGGGGVSLLHYDYAQC
jgi:hypothetical protein